MKSRHFALLAILAAVLVVAFTLGSGSSSPRISTVVMPDGSDESYGFVAMDVVLQQTDADGRLQYELLAARVERQDDDAPVVAHQLTLQYDPPGDAGVGTSGRRWSLRADEGQLPEGSAEIQLDGNVEVRALLAGSTRPLTVSTDTLRYHTGEQVVRSASDVRFSWGRQELQGRGLTANFRSGTLALESGVHGRISP